MVVKEDADTVGIVLWQHLLGAPCFRAGFCSKTIIPDSEEHPLASSRAVPKAVLRWIRAKVNVFVHHSLEELVAAMEGFVRYYNYERYHEALGNITPADMYHGRQDAILATRQEVKQKSLAERRLANLRTA